MIGKLLSEVGGRVGHGLVLAWFELYVLRLVFLDRSLLLPGQEKHIGIFHVRLMVLEIASLEKKKKKKEEEEEEEERRRREEEEGK